MEMGYAAVTRHHRAPSTAAQRVQEARGHRRSQAGPAPRGSSAPHASRLNGLALDYSGADRQADRLRAGAPGTPPTASEQIAQLQVEGEDAAHLMGRCSLASHYHLGGPRAKLDAMRSPAGAVLELAGAESDDELEMPAAPELGEEAAAGQPAQSDGAGGGAGQGGGGRCHGGTCGGGAGGAILAPAKLRAAKAVVAKEARAEKAALSNAARRGKHVK